MVIAWPMPEPAFNSKFFLIVNPGLEELALKELVAALSEIKNIKKVLGGIEFECEIYSGLELNAKLKIPSRILMRVEDLAASDFPKLFKKLQRIAWQDLIWPGTPLRFEVSSEGSRLFLKKRIASTAEDAIKKYFKALKPEKSTLVPPLKANLDEQRIFLRFIDDICTLSIDTSGEHLHKRGYRKLIGEAPLRENLASALLNALFDQSESLNAQSFELVDPMMGSGTFLLEAYHYFSKFELRDYAFENWPFIQIKSEKKSPTAPAMVKLPLEILKINKLLGFDQDDEALHITQENFSSLKRAAAQNIVNAPKFEVLQKDLFAAADLAFSASPYRILICNPPYGKRLKVTGKITDFYSHLFAQCEAKIKPALAGFLISDEVVENQIRFPKSWQLIEQLKFKNGGIKVRFLIFRGQPLRSCDEIN